MRFALLCLLVACGEKKAPVDKGPEPATKATQATPATCKTGEQLCVGDDVVACEGGKPGHKLSSCRGGCKQGACVETCGANDVELIYVVDNSNTLLAFDPRKLPEDPFRKIGTLACDRTSSPFSMAVDRTGIAWVLYTTGVLYRVSIFDAHCLARAARPRGAPPTFGMGFVTDGPKATTEKLFVVADTAEPVLATIDTTVFPTRWTGVTRLAAHEGRNPELTGTSEGKLYGYFPGDPGRGFVQEVDRASGALTGPRWSLPGDRGQVNAWAFAFWGDVFYVFLTLEGANEVHAISRKTGEHEQIRTRTPYRVVGAGVSTCAPLLEKPL